MPRDESYSADPRIDPDTVALRPALPATQPAGTPRGDAQQTWARLRLMRGPGEQKAVLLALLLTPSSARERQAWEEETLSLASAEDCRRQVGELPAAARLPALELVLGHCAALPLAHRQSLLLAARRVMCADGRVRPIDRLILLLIRHRFNAPNANPLGGVPDANELTGLPLPLRTAIADFSAYLARLVPAAEPGERVSAAGRAWHRAVVSAVWGDAPNPPNCEAPDPDTLVQVLRALQALGWMRRPVLARAWMDALQHAADWSDAPPGPGSALDLEGAEALRIACGLLDTPMPPDLKRHFSEPPPPG